MSAVTPIADKMFQCRECPLCANRDRQPRPVEGPPRSFVDGVLWPEFQELSSALTTYLAEITEKLIREEVHGETREAEEVNEPRRLGR
jgi:hypothetical protein